MQINDLTLRKLCRLYQYDISNESIIIFAFRGSYPLQCTGSGPDQAGNPEAVKTIFKKSVDYREPACSIGIWNTGTGEIAIFPGSTVPSLTYLHRNPDSTTHFNILCPGKYELKKGIHPRNVTGYQSHEALVMPGKGWVIRPELIKKPKKSAFNFNRVSYAVIFPGDNLHASHSEPLLQEKDKICPTPVMNKNFSSSGCLTIVGQPNEYVKHNYPFFWNYWEQFMLLIRYYSSAEHYVLLLFSFSDLINIDQSDSNVILRYGSKGLYVADLQERLSKISDSISNLRYYKGKINGLMKADTVIAWLKFMKDYSPDNIKGEVNYNEFMALTKHFIFTFKRYRHVIN